MSRKKAIVKRAVKLVLPFIVLAIFFLVFWHFAAREAAPPVGKLTQESETSAVEITSELARKIIDNALPVSYRKETAQSYASDFNSDGKKEIFISGVIASEKYAPAEEVFLALLLPTDNKGNYKKIASSYFNKDDGNIGERGTPSLNGSDDILDIDKDGKKEFVLDLGAGGASNEAFGIFKIDWDAKKIIWLKVKRQDGAIENTYFSEGGSATHTEDFELKDVDSDGFVEVVESFEWLVISSDGSESSQKDKYVYRWSDGMLIYNEALSKGGE